LELLNQKKSQGIFGNGINRQSNMLKEYDQITAFHYSAFRPSLHLEILKECLEEGEHGLGLDVGCGTGQSAIALTNFCKKVIGIEPSKEMLEKSIKHPRIEYKHHNSNCFNFPKNHIDIITFAGSLYYAKSQQLLDEVLRVSKETSKIIIYDFELLLGTILEKLNLDRTSKQKSNYDHQVNFSGLNQNKLKIEGEFKKSLSLEISIKNISHLLMSSKDNYSVLSESLGIENLHNKISQKLHLILKSESTLVEAKTYSIVYQTF